MTPSGATLTKQAYLGSISSGDLRYEVFAPASPIRVRFNGDTAILRYQVTIAVGWSSGNDADLFWHTDYYKRRSGAWQAVW